MLSYAHPRSCDRQFQYFAACWTCEAFPQSSFRKRCKTCLSHSTQYYAFFFHGHNNQHRILHHSRGKYAQMETEWKALPRSIFGGAAACGSTQLFVSVPIECASMPLLALSFYELVLRTSYDAGRIIPLPCSLIRVSFERADRTR